MDTVGAVTTATSIGSTIIGEAIGPHPLQLVAWGVAILSGFSGHHFRLHQDIQIVAELT